MILTTIQKIVLYAVIVVVIAAAASGVVNSCKGKRLERELKRLETKEVKIINADSLRSAIESRILDSLNKKVDRQDAKIAELTKAQRVTRRQNEKLEKRLDDINIALPDF